MRRWMISGMLAVVGCTGELGGVPHPGDDASVGDAAAALDGEVALDGDVALDASTGLDAEVAPDGGTMHAEDASAPDACAPGMETCNGVDDDCDGAVDEVASMTCGGSVGVCVPGMVACTDGAFPECTPAVGPSAETCDGRDEDCDGTTDEAIAPVACGTNTGRCSAGARTCVGASLSACIGQVEPRAERCDGIDDDCDARTDEGIAPVTCGTDVGTCRTGTRTCTGGALGACTGNIAPRSELEDGLDNDCDGTVDEGIPCESAIEGEQRRLTNLERTSGGLRALACDRGLRRAARRHAEDMCARNYFSHDSRDGRTMRNRIDAEGVVWTVIGENIAQGYSTAAAVTAGWMGSPPHRMNILDARFGRVGVGYAACSGRHYWVQDFAN